MMKQTVLLLMIMAILSGIVYAEDYLLGEKIVNFKAEMDTILVGAKEGLFKALIFRVTGNDVEIFKVIVTYGNDEKDDIPVKWIFKEGDRSRLIDLEGKNRIIKKIVFFYKTVGEKKEGKATLKVYGIQPSDIEKLGEKLVNFRAEKDTILVTAKEGRFRAILFKVTDNDVEIFKVIVTYSNGDKDDIPVKWIFKEGDRSRLINLEGNKRFIKKITFYYKTVGEEEEGKATVNVFGLR